MGQFLHYFDVFEKALESEDWTNVAECFAEVARYTVEGVPFACHIEGRQPIIEAFKRSTKNFDATMDTRILDIQSMFRLSPDCVRVELISGYGRASVGGITAPVAIEVTTSEHGIVALRDIYDPALTSPALTWLATHLSDADPSYV